MKHIFFILPGLLCLGPLSAQAPASASGTLPQSIAHFEVSRQRIRESLAEQTDLLNLQYARQLDDLRALAQSQGDLDGVLLMLEDQRRARAGEELEPLPESAPASLVQSRQRLSEAQSQLQLNSLNREKELLRHYQQHLLDMQRSLTMQNQIEAAMEVRAESQRRDAEYAEAPAPPQDIPQASPRAGTRVGIRWQRGMRPGFMHVFSGDNTTPVPLLIGNENRMGPRGLELRGGLTELDGMQKELLEAFRSTNEFTLVAVFHTDTSNQRGPARIVSFSRDTSSRNFTLGQQDDQLVLRLRTEALDGNGVTLDLGPIRVNAMNRLVFTYRPGEARAYREGRAVELPPLSGDFSNWEEAFIVFGNEKTGDRPWRGRLEGFHLMNRVMPSEAAIRASSGQNP